MRNKTWAIDMSVQIICEDHNHEKYFIKLNYSLKHENQQNCLIFKAYVCLIQTRVIHTYPKHNESTKIYAWRHVAQKDVYV